MRTDPTAIEVAWLLGEAERSAGRFLDTIAHLGREELSAPSVLPGWSRLTVAAHIAHVADAYIRVTRTAVAGFPTSTYPGGPAERDESLHSLDGCSPAEICERSIQASSELLAVWSGLDDDTWATELQLDALGPVLLGRLVALRLTELEVHHGDLGLGYSVAAWPPVFVEVCLPLRIAWLGVHHRARPAADLDIGGRWLLRAADIGRSWLVEATGPDVDCREVSAGESADAVLDGPAAGLLAYLLGRPGVLLLHIEGDTTLAEGFKQAFPGP
jgi:maleylpyruvate isomerase